MPDSRTLKRPLQQDNEDFPDDRPAQKVQKLESSSSSLYLDTVDRHRLDFDFEKLCSVSLSNLNVYACLVCGKYFQGRGPSSHAYFHSLHEDHHVYINLHNLKVYILPDGYEVTDTSLNDIKYVLKPSFSKEKVAALDTNGSFSYDLNNKRYLPGFVGLNNVKANDYVNVVIQSLAHIQPLRDYVLLNDLATGSELVKRFGTLIRKMWNDRAFKGQVSPHELLQEITNVSEKRFKLTEQSDPVEFLSWFLNALHLGFGGTRKKSSYIHEIFQGELVVETQDIRSSGDRKSKMFDEGEDIKVQGTPFMLLTLDLPPAPLYQDEMAKNIIPQVHLGTLLAKYDGRTVQEAGNFVKRYKIIKLPRYLVFHIKRFTKNNWTADKKERNPTIVQYVMKNMDMREYVDGADPNEDYRYELVANISHGRPDHTVEDQTQTVTTKGIYKVFVHCRGRDQWLQIQDLFVEEKQAHDVLHAESVIQVI
ncbi:hypothetical protein BJ742DRAFT_887602 [Cladochytrium replicatum]|nr:hypothetical protein BJ742DRAFT_887602 [Cladochytrium replicatum]